MSSRAGLSDAQYQALKSRVEDALLRWSEWLGLRWWRIDTEYVADRSQFAEHDDTETNATAMDVTADWTRLHAYIRINMLVVADLDDERLEEIIRHELCHVLVNEMQVPEWANAPNEVLWRHREAEERVVTLLTNAFGWVYQAGADSVNATREDAQ